MSPDGRRKRHFRAKNCENLAARRNYKLRSGRSSSSCGDAEIDGVWSQSRTIAFSKGNQHHHGSQFLAAVMDRWPSFNRFGSRTLPSYHRCWTAWRKHTPARTRRATPLELCNMLKKRGQFSSEVRNDKKQSSRDRTNKLETLARRAVALVVGKRLTRKYLMGGTW